MIVFSRVFSFHFFSDSFGVGISFCHKIYGLSRFGERFVMFSRFVKIKSVLVLSFQILCIVFIHNISVINCWLKKLMQFLLLDLHCILNGSKKLVCILVFVVFSV